MSGLTQERPIYKSLTYSSKRAEKFLIVQNDAKKKSNFSHLGDNAEHLNRFTLPTDSIIVTALSRILRSFEHEREGRESNLSTS